MKKRSDLLLNEIYNEMLRKTIQYFSWNAIARNELFGDMP